MKITYRTQVDSDVVYSSEKFAREVDIYLSDPDGWESQGYTFERVERNPRVVIHLSTPSTITKQSCERADLSCAEMNGRNMWINAMRWTRGAPESKQDLEHYRQYVISHEMGHILGHDHVMCPAPGQPAPIMMQQTKGIGQCKPNTKVTP